jgi:Asp-tRNA(Asn)/Glu-tRNA(Gln) amidotransferase A subunit family amidase
MGALTCTVYALRGYVLSLPGGFTTDGVPSGVQPIEAANAEATIVRIGRTFQRAADWHRRRPRLS